MNNFQKRRESLPSISFQWFSKLFDGKLSIRSWGKSFFDVVRKIARKVSPSRCDRMMKYFLIWVLYCGKFFHSSAPASLACLALADWNASICRVLGALLTTNKLGASMLIDWDKKEALSETLNGAFAIWSFNASLPSPVKPLKSNEKASRFFCGELRKSFYRQSQHL